jgi:hypothetical protein
MVLLLVVGVPAGQTDTITLGTHSPGFAGENCIPFGCPGLFAISEFQEVYSSTAFPGPILISAITFFNTVDIGESHTVTPGFYSFSLSTTSRPVGGLDTLDLSSNIGADNRELFSGALGGSPSGTELTIIATTPFSYEPGLGNLLLDIHIATSGPDTFTFFDSDAGPSAVLSRAFLGVPPEANNGLVTAFQFEPTPAPQPGSLGLLALGLTALSVMFRRRRMRSRHDH